MMWKCFPNNFGERRRRQLRGSSSVVVAWRRILLQRGWILLARRRRRCETHVVLWGFEALVCDGQNVEAEMGTKVHCTVNTTSYRRLCSCNTDPFWSQGILSQITCHGCCSPFGSNGRKLLNSAIDASMGKRFPERACSCRFLSFSLSPPLIIHFRAHSGATKDWPRLMPFPGKWVCSSSDSEWVDYLQP